MKNLNKIVAVFFFNLLVLSSAQILGMHGAGSGAGADITTLTATLAGTSLAKLRYPDHKSIRSRFTQLKHIIDPDQRKTWLTVLITNLRADDCRRARHEPPISPMTCHWQREISLEIKRIEQAQIHTAASAAGIAGHASHSLPSLAPRRLVPPTPPITLR